MTERLGARLWAAQGRLDHGRMLIERGDPLLRRLRPSAPHAIDFARLVQEGEDWVLDHQGAVARLRDSKGLRYLARLIRNPGREIHAVDLAVGSGSERARQSVTRAVKGAIERVGTAHPSLGAHLRSTVRTGALSAYVPDPRTPIIWER